MGNIKRALKELEDLIMEIEERDLKCEPIIFDKLVDINDGLKHEIKVYETEMAN